MKIMKFGFIVYFLTVVGTLIYSTIIGNSLAIVSMFGHFFFIFGIFSFYSEWKSSGKELLKDPLVLFFSIFMLVGLIMMFIPMIVIYQREIEVFFNLEMPLLAAIVFGIIFILTGLLFFFSGRQMKEESKDSHYVLDTIENSDSKLSGMFIFIGLVTAIIVLITIGFVLLNS